ncbi:MoeA N-terminal region (domain I and II) protein [Synechococcus sp. PCC 7335]|uniref:molybdopterin molybdotransferase MoeA n=1 Tax=Synechococcus sp. (strain ATCC 29403 / PCC 7335) TaxID=91464 RepID=UPI00017EBFF2|nr:gephyrin-like molybdotransferase Glp [Synechococcus sp. PCC 7335]EDX86283.1 MoeA N-terminal region (domain I and II) protein [Synechococcus sp. PCC 7335]
MLPAAEAERLIFTLVSPIEAVETLRLTTPAVAADALGRVLAEPVTSRVDFPHWDNSAMDGYAVRADDVRSVPTQLSLIEEIPAGRSPQKRIDTGQAARILTGAMLPEGADTIIMQEETERVGDRVTILAAAQLGKFVRRKGSFTQAGAQILKKGTVVAPPEVALLAATQQTELAVYRRPRIAILSTGSELAQIDQPLQPGQIVDSNQYALTALVAKTGALPVPIGIVQDDRASVKAAIASALSQADMVLSTGGVSVGDYDYVDQVLEELGAKLHIRSVAVKPGKPLTVATIGSQLYFGLPGNPASAMVSFWRFVEPAIAKLSGRQAPWVPEFAMAKATVELTAGGGRETYLWGQLSTDEHGYCFGRAEGGHNSGNLVNLVNTSGLGIVPQGQTKIAAGAPVRVLKIR